MSNRLKNSRPPCSTSADPLGVTDPLLKTSDLEAGSSAKHETEVNTFLCQSV